MGEGTGEELRARGSRGQGLGAHGGQGSQPGGDDLPISRPPLGSSRLVGGGQWGRVGVWGAAFACSRMVWAWQSLGRRVSGRRTLPSHLIPLSLLVCPIL